MQNGTVTGFDAGVVIEGGSGNTVQQVSAVDNANDMQQGPCLLGEGIAILNSSDNTITRSELRNNGPFGGVSVVGDSDANTINRNEIHDNSVVSTGGGCGRADQAEGVRVEGPGADGNVVDGNNVTNSLLAGIGLHGYVCSPVDPEAPPQDPNTGNVVVRNSVSGTAGSLSDGIAILQQGPAHVVCPAFASTVAHNIVIDNAGNGIFVSANSHHNHIKRNVVERNGGSGVYLHGPRMATRLPLLSDPHQIRRYPTSIRTRSWTRSSIRSSRSTKPLPAPTTTSCSGTSARATAVPTASTATRIATTTGGTVTSSVPSTSRAWPPAGPASPEASRVRHPAARTAETSSTTALEASPSLLRACPAARPRQRRGRARRCRGLPALPAGPRERERP